MLNYSRQVFRDKTKINVKYLQLNKSGVFSSLNVFKILLCVNIILFYYLASYGTFSPRNFSNAGRSQYYFGAALALIKGKFDVDPQYLEGWNGECFHYKNGCFGYFGLFPSVLRIPIIFIFNGQHNFQIFFLVFSYAAIVIGLYYLIKLIMKWLNIDKLGYFQVIVLAVLTTFTPFQYLAIRGYMYEEAILWGIAFLMSTLGFLLKYTLSRNDRYFYLANLCAAFALHSRIIEGVSSFVACILVLFLFPLEGRLKHLYRKVTVWAFLGASFPLSNFLKFGVVNPSITHHGGYITNPAKLQLVEKCGEMNISRLPVELFLYLFPNFKNFPFGTPYSPNQYTFRFAQINVSSSCIESGEYFIPLSITYFLSFILSLLLLWNLRKLPRSKIWILIFLPLMVNILLISSFLGMTQRYIADIFPFFLLLSIITTLTNPNLFRLKYFKFLWGMLITFQVVLSYVTILIFWTIWLDRPPEFSHLPLAKNDFVIERIEAATDYK